MSEDDERGLLGFDFHPGSANPGSPGFHHVSAYTSVPPQGPACLPVGDVVLEIFNLPSVQ